MAIILRLQGLDVKAGTEDIRTFFECLHIPDGGVYIVGGSLREAFIAFNTEKDAQRAMRCTGNFLKGSRVTLHLSSMAEMESKLESLLKKKRKTCQPPVKSPPSHAAANISSLNTKPQGDNTANLSPSTAQQLDPDAVNTSPVIEQHVDPNTATLQSLDSNTAFLLGICTVLQGLQSAQQTEGNNAALTVDFSKTDSTAILSDEARTPEPSLDSGPGYVRLFGMPASATKEDICHFFRGLTVEEAVVNAKLGLKRGCIVKFAKMQDACEALHFNQQSLGPVCVEVRGASEKMWNSVLQECENGLVVVERQKPQQNPLQEGANHRQNPTSALPVKRRSLYQLPSKPPKKLKFNSDSGTHLPPATEYVVMVSNLPQKMTKTEIKQLFGCPDISHKNVLHLLDEEGNRTDTAFLIFNCTEDYNYAVNLTGCHVGSVAIEVSSITKEMMRQRMAETHPRYLSHCLKTHTMKTPGLKKKSVETSEVPPNMNTELAAQTCLYVRNMPANVQKPHVMKLFSKYRLRKENIVLLHDSDGNSIGEAVVEFKSERAAALAQRIHGNDFLGTTVLLTCITVKQMEDILARR